MGVIDNLYTLAAVQANTTVIAGISGQNFPLAANVLNESADGEVFPRHTSLVGQDPRISFTSMAIADALAAIGVVGWDIAGAGLIAYLQKKAKGGTREGSGHRAFTVPNGLVVPRTLSCQHQGNASIQYEVLMESSDGFAEPFTIGDAASIPAVAAGNVERFTLGPITVGGVVLDEFRSLELNFGIDARAEGAESHLYPTFTSIAQIAPTITVRGVDPQWLEQTTGIPIKGKAAAHGNTVIQLRKRLSGGSYVADGTAEHIAITASGYVTIETAMDVTHPGDAECALMINCNSDDGVNAPFLIDTASAIPPA